MFHFDVKGAKIEIDSLENQMNRLDFWDNQENAQMVLKKIKILKDKISSFEKLKNDFDEINLLISMALEEEDSSVEQEVLDSVKLFVDEYEKTRISTLLSEEYDRNNAIISLHAGAGGTEACDWVSMLLRMYSRWAEKNNYKLEILDYLDGEEAGTKSVTFQLTGENAYGYIKSEKGVHRLVRISPFDSSGRRHTSFASCDVTPEIDDDSSIDVNEEELRIDTYRSSGAGGQHVNTTDSAVRITHLPTGIVVQCQNERSQHKNKDKAMKMLKSKLYELKQQEQMDKIQGIRGEMKEIGWGSQIRSYVMHPYSMVKDHRTDQEIGNVNAVMDGEIDVFINSYLKWINTKKS